MIVPRDLQFGRIALKEGRVDRKQLEIALRRQREGNYYESLGRIMVSMGFLSKGDVAEILRIQQSEIENAVATTTSKETLFGAIAVMKRYVSLTQVEECLREQRYLRRLGLYMRLGEILVSKKYMTLEQVLDVLQQQRTEIRECPSCRRTYNITTFSRTKEQSCPACGTALKPLRKPRSPHVDGRL